MTDPAAPPAPRGIVVVTGTGTGVGKTVVTAALAAIAQARGARVAVVKPAQTGVRTGVPGGDTPDVDAVRRLAGVTDTHELARFPDPLSPEAAARTAGLPPPDMGAAADYVRKLAESRDLVLVEGAGGLLVRYDPEGTTIADLAVELGAPAVVVAAAGLGTLNHTALTCVIGSWPRQPGLAELANLTDLAVVAGEPIAGLLPEGSGMLGRTEFLAIALAGLGPRLGGEAARAGAPA